MQKLNEETTMDDIEAFIRRAESACYENKSSLVALIGDRKFCKLGNPEYVGDLVYKLLDTAGKNGFELHTEELMISNIDTGETYELYDVVEIEGILDIVESVEGEEILEDVYNGDIPQMLIDYCNGIKYKDDVLEFSEPLK